MNQLAKDKIILALDVDNIKEVRKIVKELHDYVGMFKVGFQLFCKEGPDIFKMIHDEGGKVFFDGKFMDIPNTVAQASVSIMSHNVTFFNLHILGGKKMMEATVEAANNKAINNNLPKPIILGVTILTSFDFQSFNEVFLDYTQLGISNYVFYLSRLAQESGLSGIIASAEEAKEIRRLRGKDFLIITPGIRPNWSVTNDQKRILTPKLAIEAGADMLVIGRPILNALNKVEATMLITQEIEEALKGE